MSFALIRDSDRRIVEIQEAQGGAFPDSSWVQGTYDRNLHIGRIMLQDGTVDMSPDAETIRLSTFTGDTNVAQMISNLKTANLTQITNYVNTNVTDLASAKVMLIRLSAAVSYLAKRGG